MYVKGVTKSGYYNFCGIIHKIYDLEYNTCTSPKTLVIFYCVLHMQNCSFIVCLCELDKSNRVYKIHYMSKIRRFN